MSDEKTQPRYAKTPADLIFYTDTDSKDYPIYLLPNYEVMYKKRPEDAEKIAVFHVKSTSVSDCYDHDGGCYKGYPIFHLSSCKNNYEEFLNYHLHLKELVDVVNSLKLRIHIRILEISYEVYKGDYDELIGEVRGNALSVIIEPPYDLSSEEKKKWAITYTTLKRILAKLTPEAKSVFERLAYTDSTYGGRKGGSLVPFIKIKIPLPTQEFVDAFEKVKKYFEEVEEVEVTEEKVTEEGVKEVEIPIEIEFKPKELEVEFETSPPTTVPTAVAPPTSEVRKSELVKIYLLSMKFPSKYLVQKFEVKENEEVRKWEGISAEIGSRLEGIRRKAYDMISRIFCNVEEYGTWIAISEEAVKEAEKISEWVRDELSKLRIKEVRPDLDINSIYSVKVIPIYLEPEHAVELLNKAISYLSKDVAELEKKIAEAETEKTKKSLNKIMEDMNYKKALLETFKKYLNEISK